MLVSGYVILAIAFYLLPAKLDHNFEL